MDIDNELLKSLFWFAAGAISFRFLSSLLLSGLRFMLIEKAIIQTLILFRFADESYTAILELRSEKIQPQEEFREVLQDSLESDNITLNIWRAASINGIINHCPGKFRHVIKFKDWRTAMNYLSGVLKEDI